MQLKSLLRILIVNLILFFFTQLTTQAQDFNQYEDTGMTGPRYSLTFNKQFRANQELFIIGQEIPHRAKVGLNSLNARFFNRYLLALRVGISRKIATVDIPNHFGSNQSLIRKDWRLLLGVDYLFELGDLYIYPSFYLPIPLQSDNPADLEYDYLRNWLGKFDRMRTSLGVKYTVKTYFTFGIEMDVNLAQITERFRDTWNFYTPSEMLKTQYSLMLTLGIQIPR